MDHCSKYMYILIYKKSQASHKHSTATPQKPRVARKQLFAQTRRAWRRDFDFNIACDKQTKNISLRMYITYGQRQTSEFESYHRIIHVMIRERWRKPVAAPYFRCEAEVAYQMDS